MTSAQLRTVTRTSMISKNLLRKVGISRGFRSAGVALLVGPNKGETAVCGCHCPRDMAVRMREVLARQWVGICVPLALSLVYFQCISN